VTYTVVNQWQGGFQSALTISNTGSTNLNGWSLTFSFANGQQISQSWNATYVQSGNLATLTNASYDGTLAPGATISSIGFLASTNGTNTAPTTFKLNGALCSQ
jgi:hypothetical protein